MSKHIEFQKNGRPHPRHSQKEIDEYHREKSFKRRQKSCDGSTYYGQKRETEDNNPYQ